jgi:hypothetical protein
VAWARATPGEQSLPEHVTQSPPTIPPTSPVAVDDSKAKQLEGVKQQLKTAQDDLCVATKRAGDEMQRADDEKKRADDAEKGLELAVDKVKSEAAEAVADLTKKWKAAEKVNADLIQKLAAKPDAGEWEKKYADLQGEYTILKAKERATADELRTARAGLQKSERARADAVADRNAEADRAGKLKLAKEDEERKRTASDDLAKKLLRERIASKGGSLHSDLWPTKGLEMLHRDRERLPLATDGDRDEYLKLQDRVRMGWAGFEGRGVTVDDLSKLDADVDALLKLREKFDAKVTEVRNGVIKATLAAQEGAAKSGGYIHSPSRPGFGWGYGAKPITPPAPPAPKPPSTGEVGTMYPPTMPITGR